MLNKLLSRSLFFLCYFFSALIVVAAPVQRKAAIASAHPLATQAGFTILKQGGNAFDAAVAISATLAVVEPASSGLGGGGFWLLHRASDNFNIMIDGRETAPFAAHRDMYLDDNGKFNKTLALDSVLAAAIPGVPAALDHLNKRYGALSLHQTLAPAIYHAKHGFKVSKRYQKLADFRLKALKASADSNRILLRDGTTPKVGTIITQHDLAHTLEKMAQHGRAGFYQGDIAKKLVDDVRINGGIWTLADLKRYQIKERQPITGAYAGYKVTSAALPSSGGIVLMSMLNQLEHLKITNLPILQKRHIMIEAMRRAYFDRKRLGDADFSAIPVKKLTAKHYAQTLASSIDLKRASRQNGDCVTPFRGQGEDTTHFSVMDQYGNRVAATLSINYPFGSGFIAKGTGVLLNDEMDDFSASAGAANVYGLIGGEQNSIAGNKRPLSSMTPTFIENNDRLMIIGTPGGSRIITMVLLGMLDFIDGKKAIDIVSAPRFHHQCAPNQVQVESIGFADKALADLSARGHQVNKLNRQYGNMQIVIYNKKTGKLTAASDPRGEGLSLVE